MNQSLSLSSLSFPCAVAVSGGADSLALLLLVHSAAQAQGGRVVALTVDHGLRSDSAEEAEWVQRWATERGIEHIILKWEGEKPTSCLHEKAREARYDLLLSWCKAHQISTLFLGHHQQDQEETFWLRLSGGSGLDGLACMSEVAMREGITLMRPLLSVPKETLQNFLKEQGQDWIEDLSNHNPLFFRGKLRKVLEEQDFSSHRLNKTICKLRQDADFIRESLSNVVDRIVSCHEAGYLSLDSKAFWDLHPALSGRLIALCMRWFSGSPYSPRSETLQEVISRLQTKDPFTAGSIYWFSQKGRLYLCREIAAVAAPFPLRDIEKTTLWDNRFWIDPEIKHHAPEKSVVAPLRQGIKDVETGEIPRRLLPSFLALWDKEKVVAVPHLCYNLSTVERDLKKFIQTSPFFHTSLRLVR